MRLVHNQHVRRIHVLLGIRLNQLSTQNTNEHFDKIFQNNIPFPQESHVHNSLTKMADIHDDLRMTYLTLIHLEICNGII